MDLLHIGVVVLQVGGQAVRVLLLHMVGPGMAVVNMALNKCEISNHWVKKDYLRFIDKKMHTPAINGLGRVNLISSLALP